MDSDTERRRRNHPSFAAFVHDLVTIPSTRRDQTDDYELLSTGGVVIDDTIEIVRELDRGGMGRVFLGRDRSLGRDVAVKVLNAFDLTSEEKGSIESLAHEARATAQLKHPNIVTVHRYGSWNGLPYIVFELVEGDSLSERLAAGPLPLAEALPIARQILSGLQHSHSAGVLHRDLKPSNVFVRPDGSVTIIDFGIASMHWSESAPAARRAIEDDPTATAARAGTPAYMSPEQWHGQPQDQRTDLWAAGLILAEMVTGKTPPTVGTTTVERSWPPPEAFERVATRADRRRLREVAQLVRRATAVRPEDRYGDAGEMLAALDRVAARRGSRWPVVAAVVAVAAVGVAGWRWLAPSRVAGPVESAPRCAWSGRWATLATSPTGSYPFDIEVTTDGASAEGRYSHSAMAGVIEEAGARSAAPSIRFRGTWSRLGGEPSGGPCAGGRFSLEAHHDADEGCVFTGYWSYCDDPPDATGGWWWRGRKLDE